MGPKKKTGNAKSGKKLYKAYCAGCHSLKDNTDSGPALGQIYGRQVASRY